jgi:propanediol utilization protein
MAQRIEAADGTNMTALAPSRIDRKVVERVVRQVVYDRFVKRGDGKAIDYRPRLVVNISARHVHVTQEDLERLFGAGAKLSVYRQLYQDGEFASEQTVSIIGPRQRLLTNVRILGPCRNYTQVELAFTDGISLGIELPVRCSGDHHDTPGCYLQGPNGIIELKSGVIRAERHVHMGDRDLEFYGAKPNERMHLRVDSDCPAVLENLLVRYGPKLKLEVHLDTDEGNATNLTRSRLAELIRP